MKEGKQGGLELINHGFRFRDKAGKIRMGLTIFTDSGPGITFFLHRQPDQIGKSHESSCPVLEGASCQHIPLRIGIPNFHPRGPRDLSQG